MQRLIRIIKLSLIFIIAPPLGYILHEGGHYIFGLFNGFEMSFHYNRVVPTNHDIYKSINYYLSNYTYNELTNKLKSYHTLFYLGGPIITVFVSTLGFVLIKYRIHNLLGFILGLNILREIYMSLLNIFYKNSWNDEKQICFFLDSNIYLFNILLLALSIYILLKIILSLKNEDRFVYIISSVFGVPIGLFLWLNFGQYIF